MTTKFRAVMVACTLVGAACSGGSGDASDSSVAPPEQDEAVDDDNEASTTVPAVDGDPGDADPEVDDPEDDEQDDASDGSSDARYLDGDSSYLFDQEQLHTFEIDLPDEALGELDSNPSAEEYVEGSLTFDGETLDAVGVRYKGSVGAFVGCTSGGSMLDPTGPKSCTKLSLKLKINWNGADTEFYGQRKVQLHSMNLDPTMMRDRLGYWLFEQAGVAAPRSTHARVVVNGEFVGVFALVEQIDGRFTRDRFEDGTGNLYKEQWPIDDDSAVVSPDVLIDSLETNEDEDPSVDLVTSFAQEILDSGAATDPDAAREVFAKWTDVDALVSYAVVDRAIRNDDGLFHWYCFSGPCEPHNFFVYEETESKQIRIIPWDLDNSFENLRGQNPVTYIADDFGDTQADCAPFTAGPFPVTQRSAACDPIIAAWALLDTEFDATDAEFRAGPFSIDQVEAQVEAWAAQIAPSVAEAAEMYGDAPSIDEWEAAVERLLDDVANSSGAT